MVRAMRTATAVSLPAALAAAALVAGCGGGSPSPAAGGPAPARFSHPTRIDNRYLPITRFGRCELAGVGADGERERSVVTVLDRRRTFHIGGRAVDAVVVRDDAYEDGRLVERTHDFFAQSDAGTVYYLGEDVTDRKDGKGVDTPGGGGYGRAPDG